MEKSRYTEEQAIGAVKRMEAAGRGRTKLREARPGISVRRASDRIWGEFAKVA